jgi:two-component system chemotaxis response regulator CheY
MPAERDLKILVVDDFAATRNILINTLAQLGYNNTDEADDGYSALVKLKSAIFDFVVLEWNMSKISGMELLEQIRAIPNLKKIPVLMVTEDGLQENIVAAVKAGLNASVIKPVEVNKFEKIFEKIFE